MSQAQAAKRDAKARQPAEEASTGEQVTVVEVTDELLDEIDAVLEDASEVLQNYRQRGGE